MSFDWKKLVGTVAPTIASVFGTPLAGMGVSAVLTALGITEADPVKVESKISEVLAVANPDVLLKLKTADQQFQLDMKKAGIDLEKLAYDDKASARARQIALKDKTPAVLAYLLTIGFFSVLGGLFSIEIPEGNKAIVYSMAGCLGTVWIAAMAYYHGSSLGSRNKDTSISELSNKYVKQ